MPGLPTEVGGRAETKRRDAICKRKTQRQGRNWRRDSTCVDKPFPHGPSTSTWLAGAPGRRRRFSLGVLQLYDSKGLARLVWCFSSLCVGITVLQIVFAMLGNGPQITTVVSGGEGIIYDQLIPYSGILASVWMLSVSATIWFVFRHRNRAAGVLLSCLSPFAYVFLVSIIWSGWIHPSLFWKLQLMTGTLDSIGNISKYQIVTDPTAVVVAFIIAGIAIGAYKITPTKKSLSDENAA